MKLLENKAPIKNVLPQAFFLSLDLIKTQVLGSVLNDFGAEVGTHEAQVYQDKWALYKLKVFALISKYKDACLAHAELSGDERIILEDMTNKLDWIWNTETFTHTWVTLETLLPLLSPGLITDYITPWFKQNQDAWAEVSYYFHKIAIIIADINFLGG